ncbi:hypothetical protein F441_09136 [Phytophthora nicotianae CJ01A1]|uniref:FYVE-type domain-containing protein n=2 Tax=Phytophthora nicotianae TaxID=4792 RepID=W2GVR6_PHYNI|nr:hypothetical protein L915_08985 [Phytophthora nicotianae]ETL39816.1 hypothetical protein L916_08897 [Phytophthora nicotianae]ETP16247.1 hypothetical protein F441_09136 [Phytophthora nicotianae CJ01A1]KUF93216.1 hypothetical protein AM588_10009118 [Phytophthora nicotianae]
MDRVNVVYPPKPFALSAADAVSLEHLADQLVAETLRTHDDFVSQGRIVDPTRWKVVKEKHNMTAYRTRKRASTRFRRDRVSSDETEAVAASPQMPSFYPVMDKKMEHALSETYPSVTFLEADSEDELEHDFSYVDVLEQNVLEKSRPDRVPLVFCTGVVPGTVEDAALGFFADTEQRSRMRNSRTKEVAADDTRILARLQGPTQDDPFRFLGIKWCVQTTRGAAGRFIKPRDYAVLESTGMALDSDGKRFSYILNHSIELDEVPDFRSFGNVRIVFSACHIVMPHSTGAIETFSRGFMDTRGYISERLCTYMYCDGLMTIPQTVEEAYTKKLLWLFQAQRRADRSRRLASLQVSDMCPCCHQKLHTGFAKLLDGNCMCQLCRKTMCRKCTVKKTLPIDIEKTNKAMDFCLSCYLEAKNLPAWHVAMATRALTT